jgi:hypothetical protein
MLGIMSVGLVSAQTIVSTSVSKKNPVLEEFTGVNCQYCPDGHKLANGLKENNPSSVLINIHAGGYANTTPDYRTIYGEPIDDQTGLTGYPAGTVNRKANIAGVTYMSSGATAMSRGSWTNAFAQIKGQNSPVNIAIEPSYNEATNEITCLVEVYYTAATDTVDYLNVALLQSNIKGPQSSAATYYPEMLYPDGQYNHNHMFRHFLTGQWGIEIPVAGAGTFWDSTFVYTLPSSYYSIPTNWQDMEIAAYIANTTQDIYTGTAKWLIPEENMWDIKLTTSSAGASDYCETSTDVSVAVKNNGVQTIASFDLGYSINGGTATTYSFSGAIAPGGTTTIPLTVSLISGLNEISFNKLINVFDNNGNELFNPTPAGFAGAEGVSIISVESGKDTPFNDDFESVSIGSQPDLFHVAESNGTYPIVISQDYATFITNSIGGHGESENSLWYGLGYSSIPVGTSFSIVSDNFDFTDKVQGKMEFSYAYASLTSSDNSKFTVDASIDCGATWDNLLELKGSEMVTAGVDAQYIVMPEAGEWADEEVSLDAYSGEPSVMLRYRITKDATNGLFLDDINVSAKTQIEITLDNGQTAWVIDGDTFILYEGQLVPLGAENLAANESNVSIFPNPSTGMVNISGLTERSEVKVMDIRGSVVIRKATSTGSLDLSKLEAGVYTVSVKNSAVSKVEKLTIVK